MMVTERFAASSCTNPNANDANRGVMYHPDADRRSWQAIESFFEELLR